MAKFEKQKYKIGTLVELSAAGTVRHQNWRCVGGFGIIMSFNKYAKYPYSTQWVGLQGPAAHEKPQVFKGYELKKLKPDKK